MAGRVCIQEALLENSAENIVGMCDSVYANCFVCLSAFSFAVLQHTPATLQFAMMAKFQQELTDACTQLLTVLIGTRLNTAPGQTVWLSVQPCSACTQLHVFYYTFQISNAILCKVIMLLCRLPRLFQFAVGGLTKRISSCAHALSKAMHR